MSKVYVISDLHIGHRSIIKFSPDRFGFQCLSVEEHDETLIERWNSVVRRRDVVWVLGDVLFDRTKFHLLSRLNGQKNMVGGNHDKWSTEEYLKYFQKIRGYLRYKGMWFSHAPIHPLELRGRVNVHGHVHNLATPLSQDKRYINVTVEALKGYPISIDELKVIESRIKDSVE